MTTQFDDSLSPAGKRFLQRTDFSALESQDSEQVRTLIEQSPSFQKLPQAKRDRVRGLVEGRLKAAGVLTDPPPPEPVTEEPKERESLLKFDPMSPLRGQAQAAEGLALTALKPFMALGGATTAALGAGLDEENLGKPFLERVAAQDRAAGAYMAEVFKAGSFSELPTDGADKITEHFFPALTGWKKTGASVATSLILDPLVVGPLGKMRTWQKALDDVAKKMMTGQVGPARGVVENAMLQVMSYLPRTPATQAQLTHWKTLARKADALGNNQAGRRLVQEMTAALPDNPQPLAPEQRWVDEVLNSGIRKEGVGEYVPPLQGAAGPEDGSVVMRVMGDVEQSLYAPTPQHIEVRSAELQKVISERGTSLTMLEAEAAKSEALFLRGAKALGEGDVAQAEKSLDAIRQQVVDARKLRQPAGAAPKDEFVEMQAHLQDSMAELEQAIVAHRVKTEGTVASKQAQVKEISKRIQKAVAPPEELASSTAKYAGDVYETTKAAKTAGRVIESRARYKSVDSAQIAIGERGRHFMETHEPIQIGDKWAVARKADTASTSASPTAPTALFKVDSLTGETITPVRAVTSALVDASDEASVTAGVAKLLDELADAEFSGMFSTEVLNKLEEVPLSAYRRAFEAARRGNVKSIQEAVVDIFDTAGVKGVELPKSAGMKAKDILKSQAGAVEFSPIMLRHMATQVAGLTGGIDFDAEDGVPFGPFKLGWSLEKYLNSPQAHVAWGISGLSVAAKGWKSHGDKFWNKVEQHPKLFSFLRSYHETERLPKQLWEFMQGVKKGPDLILRKHANQLKKLVAEFSEDELKLISDVIEQEGPNWAKAPHKVTEAAKEFQGILKNIRHSLIDAGFPEEVVTKYGDKHFHRIYRGKDTSFIGRAAKSLKISGSFLLARGPDPRALKKGQLEDLHKFVPDATPGDKVYEFTDLGKNYIFHERDPRLANARQVLLKTHEYFLEDVPKKGMSLKRDYTKWERTAMGEERNSVVRMLDFVREASNDIILGKAFQDIARNPSLSVGRKERTAIHANWVYVPEDITTGGVKKYGAAAGRYVSPDVKYLLDGMTNRRFHAEWADALYKSNKKFLGIWKLGKTAMQSSTHGINTFSNFMLSWMRGDNPARVAIDGAREVMGQGRYFQEAVDLGLLDGNILRAEADIGKYVDSLLGTRDKKFFEQAKEFLSNPVRDIWRRGIRVYEFEDEMFKVGTYLARRREGVDPQAALKAANELFFDYRDVPRGVAALRDWGLVPFVTWSYKAMHAIPRLVQKRPERVAAVMMGWQAWNDANYAIMFENGAKEAEIQERHLTPPWMRGQHERMFGIGPNIARRQLTEEGEPAKFADWGRWVMPLSDIMATKAGTLIIGHPMAQLGLGTLFDKHLGFGRPIMPHKATDPDIELTEQQRAENLTAWASFMSQTLLPNMPWVPGSFSSRDMGRMLVNEGVISPEMGANVFNVTGNDNAGVPVSANRFLTDLIGMKTREVNLPLAADKKVRQYLFEYNKAVKAYTSLAIKQDQQGSVTDKDMEKAYSNVIEAEATLTKRVAEHERIMRGGDREGGIRRRPRPTPPTP